MIIGDLVLLMLSVICRATVRYFISIESDHLRNRLVTGLDQPTDRAAGTSCGLIQRANGRPAAAPATAAAMQLTGTG